jgi:anaerobic selenocysteine-containing dehydrogenase
MGFDDACFDESEDDMIRGVLKSGHPFLEGITLERLERERSVRLNVSAEGEPFLPFANGGFGTASRKCEFHAETISYEPPLESRRGDRRLRARFPLELISPKNHDSMNSTFGERDDVDRDTGTAWLHPADAAPRGIATGDQIRIYNERGACMLRACVLDTVASGVVSVPSTRWARRAADGRNINALTSQRLTDIGGGPTFYSCLVEVEKLGD